MTTAKSLFPSSPRATSGGTPAAPSHYAPHDDNSHVLRQQSSRDLVRAIASEHLSNATSTNIEQPHVAIYSSRSSRSSSSSSVFQRQDSSLSPDSQQIHSEHSEIFGHMNIDSTIMPHEPDVKSRDRARELSAPLPSVPPSTPASAISHRSSFSQSQHRHPAISPSFLRHGSPIFASPLTELSDSEEAEQDLTELSDSNSIEIISGYVTDPFVTGRYKDFKSSSQDIPQPAQASCSPTPSSCLSLINNTCTATQQVMEQPSSIAAALSTSQTPTPHPLSQSSSLPYHILDSELKSMTEASDSSHISSSTNSMSPPRAQSRPGAKCESRLSSEESSPTTAPGIMKPVYELRDGSESKSVHDNDASLRTPNVYINGLPPHFADESLYLMTRDFGNVLSVRTFTRCVGEKMSGYGFVLFDSVESAERCIETLRKYRNLHPSFSKQIHKIPGTPYASGTITIPPTGSLPSLASQHSMSTLSSFPSMTSTLVSSTTSSSLPSAASPSKANGHRTGESVSTTTSSDFSGKEMNELSFREKMERLKDEQSTNLYMEGLPLSIDDVSLSALISPHKIISSRFFQTKLSNPPRMIAFVRLDTRVGAEEIIDRLHGRVVRGWNDNGCRISVRFADTNEQRELRRSERLNRGEEELSNGHQLSMAHAALLNLRGAEAQAQLGNATLRQHMHVANLDHRPPVTLSSVQSVDTMSTESNGANADSFQRLNILHHSSHALGNIQPDIARTAQYYHRTPSLSHQSQAVPLDNATSAMTLLNGSTGLFDANQLALLQQQTQLQQLQLLKQMQSMGFDPTFAIDDRGLNRSRPLMPSADITTNEVDGTRAQVATSQLTSCQTAHRRNDSNSHTQQHTGSYSKGDIPNFPSPALQHATRNGRYMEHGINNDQLVGKQHQYPLNRSPPSPSSSHVTHFLRTRSSHQEGLVSNFDHYRGTAVEESEVTLISPALTYASRTPSTLSPATPLFNVFGTPASVPATVPRGKANVRERDFSRFYKNDLRQ